MRLKIYIFLNRCVILYILLKFGFAKAIVGENVRQARPEEFPSVVAIKTTHNASVQPEDARICTGALISAFNVLTAAHCLEMFVLGRIEIIVGSIDIRAGMKHFPLWWIDYNQWANKSDEYKKYRINDIGVVKLTEPVDAKIKPSDPTMIPTVYTFGLDALTAAWGVTNDGKNPRFLQTVTLRILSNNQCEERIKQVSGETMTLAEPLMCSFAEPYALLIVGDSGCPIFIGGLIVGVHKSTCPFPEQTIHPDKVNVHTAVWPFRDFILNVMNSGDRYG